MKPLEAGLHMVSIHSRLQSTNWLQLLLLEVWRGHIPGSSTGLASRPTNDKKPELLSRGSGEELELTPENLSVP